jgi:hypothetical protein
MALNGETDRKSTEETEIEEMKGRKGKKWTC